MLHATVKTTEQSMISNGLNMRSMTEIYIHETGKSTSKGVQSDFCMKNKNLKSPMSSRNKPSNVPQLIQC